MERIYRNRKGEKQGTLTSFLSASCLRLARFHVLPWALPGMSETFFDGYGVLRIDICGVEVKIMVKGIADWLEKSVPDRY